jgi:phosphoribosylamine--glycine ligase
MYSWLAAVGGSTPSPGSSSNPSTSTPSISPRAMPAQPAMRQNVAIADSDVPALVHFAQEKKVGLAVVGPEDPLALGLVDALEAAGIKAFGPSGAAARLEADKAFAKQLMRSSSVSTAEARVFDRFEDAKAYIASRDEPVVVKAAGLAKGKGVVVLRRSCGRNQYR